jgi:adenine-specific DNA-methyltransferase
MSQTDLVIEHIAPDIALQHDGETVRAEIRGLDLYHPFRDEVKARSVADIAYSMIDDEAFDRLYRFVSHPIPLRAGRRVAVRVVSLFGEESTKVLQP